VHTGGTLGMDEEASYEAVDGHADDRPLRKGTGGAYAPLLAPGHLLAQLTAHAPEISTIANIDVRVALNTDSCRLGPKQWVLLARLLDRSRADYDAFVVVHGTDTMAFTAAALSLCLAGFRKPIILTGSQRPLSRTRTDARQNLVDAVTCATAGRLEEVALCFGGLLLRGNRSQKVSTTAYRAFDSPSHPPLAVLGVDVEWNEAALFKDPGVRRWGRGQTRARWGWRGVVADGSACRGPPHGSLRLTRAVPATLCPPWCSPLCYAVDHPLPPPGPTLLCRFIAPASSSSPKSSASPSCPARTPARRTGTWSPAAWRVLS